MAELLDNFTAANGSALLSHTSDSGASWTSASAFSGTATINSNAVVVDSGDFKLFEASWVPASANYEVIAKYDITDGIGASAKIGPAMRVVGTTGYGMFVSATDVSILDLGVTFLGAQTFAIPNGSYYFTIGAVGSTIYCAIQRISDSKWLSPSKTWVTARTRFISVTSTSVSVAGKAGIWLGVGSASTHPTCDSVTTGPAYGPVTFSVTSPAAYQVAQRDGTGKAAISISGTYTGLPSAIEASWNGGAYETIVASPAGGTFTGALAAKPKGQGTLTVRWANLTDVSQDIAYVGIGEVFVIAGQSNASGYGTNNQTYSHATLKACLFGNDYVWKDLVDPTDGPGAGAVDAVSNDGGLAAGSFWPAMVTDLMASLNCPVAIIPCAKGGTSITSWLPGADHADRTTLYGSMKYRAALFGSVRAVLWHQGESDALTAMSQATYNGHLDTVANAVGSDLGVKMFCAILQNSTGIPDADEAKIRAATTQAIGDNANVAAGPDFSDLSSDDDYHLQTNLKVTTAGQRWAAKLLAANLFSTGGGYTGGGLGGRGRIIQSFNQ